MTQTLYDAAKRFADMHADANGVATTPFPGVVILRETRDNAVSRRGHTA
jgi:hypothetical protein